MQTSTSPEAQKTNKKKGVGVSTSLMVVLLAVPWILVAVPGQMVDEPYGMRGHPGSGTIQEYGWPYVHASRLYVDPVLHTFTGQPLGPNPSGPSLQRLHDGLWSERGIRLRSFENQFDEIDKSKTIFKAQRTRSASLINGKIERSRYWSDPVSWQYCGEHSILKWNLPGLLINVACFVLYVTVAIALLEFRRRRRNTLIQVSLFEFIVFASVICIVSGYMVSEYRYCKQQKELEHVLNEQFNTLTSYEDVLPAWVPRLFDGYRLPNMTDGSFEMQGSWPPNDNMFFRIGSLHIKPRIQYQEYVDQENLAAIFSRKELADVHLVYLDVWLKSHEKLLASVPTNNVQSLRIHNSTRNREPLSLRAVERFANLRSLELRNIDFEHLAGPNLPNLVELELRDCESPDYFLKWLSNLPKLREISGDNQLLDCLGQLPTTIEELSIATNRPVIDLASLKRLQQLRRLSIVYLDDTPSRSNTATIVNPPNLPYLKRIHSINVKLDENSPIRWRALLEEYK